MKLFPLFLIITPLISANVVFKEGDDCIAQYLLEKNLLEDKLKNFTLSTEIDCKNHVKKVKSTMKQEFDEFLEGLGEEFKTAKGKTNSFRLPKGASKEAIRSSIDEPSIVDAMMKGTILFKAKDPSRYTNIIEALELELVDQVYLALLSFASKEDFSEILINARADIEPEYPNHLIEGYCLREYLSNKGIDIELNPYNITIPSDESCTGMKEIFENLPHELMQLFVKVLSTKTLSEDLQRCIKSSIRSLDAESVFIPLVLLQSEIKDYEIQGKARLLFIWEEVKIRTLECNEREMVQLQFLEELMKIKNIFV